MTRRFRTGMGRMQPLPVIVFPTHPPTAWSFSPAPMLLRELRRQQLARGGEPATAVLVRALRAAGEATDLEP